MFNMLFTPSPDAGGMGSRMAKDVLFPLNIKQHFVDNYCSFQLSLHKPQFGAALSLQGIRSLVLFFICFV